MPFQRFRLNGISKSGAQFVGKEGHTPKIPPRGIVSEAAVSGYGGHLVYCFQKSEWAVVRELPSLLPIAARQRTRKLAAP